MSAAVQADPADELGPIDFIAVEFPTAGSPRRASPNCSTSPIAGPSGSSTSS
jgi:hypothetical protein